MIAQGFDSQRDLPKESRTRVNRATEGDSFADQKTSERGSSLRIIRANPMAVRRRARTADWRPTGWKNPPCPHSRHAKANVPRFPGNSGSSSASSLAPILPPHPTPRVAPTWLNRVKGGLSLTAMGLTPVVSREGAKPPSRAHRERQKQTIFVLIRRRKETHLTRARRRDIC
jgi:hypothetical protein